MVTTSRIELLKQRQLLKRALLGVELLEERLGSLLDEFKQLAKEISITYDEVTKYDSKAIIILGHAIADEGNVLQLLADATPKTTIITVDTTKILGMIIPKLPKSTPQLSDHNFPITISSAVSLTAERFHDLYFAYLNYIEQVIVLQRLGNEIKRTRRQIIVLENDIIPEIRSIIRKIELILEEYEREEQVRLRRFKAYKGRSQ